MVGQSNVLGTLTSKHVHLLPAVFFQFHLEEGPVFCDGLIFIKFNLPVI